MGGPDGIDAYDLGDALRSLNLNPTLAMIEKLGGTKQRKLKMIKFDEFLPIYSQIKKEKEQGCYEDFIECLKLYDKQEDGTMLLAELQHALLSLGKFKLKEKTFVKFLTKQRFAGENLEDEQVEALFADCMDPEDDEGMIPYSRKFSINCF